jgi:hypothetical protein
MPKFDRKKLILGIAHAAVFLGLLICEIAGFSDSLKDPRTFHYVLRGYITLAWFFTHFGWLLMYDAYKPSAKIFDFTFRKERTVTKAIIDWILSNNLLLPK